MASLTATQKRYLRQLAHDQRPVVLIGAAGLSKAVIAELDAALDHHELVKVRIRSGDHDQREATITRMCRETDAQLVQRIGHTVVLYRRHPQKPRIRLPS
jgi:RNA-binding protein